MYSEVIVAEQTEPKRTELMTVQQVAAYLGVSQCWVRDHVCGRRQPALPVIRIGGRRAVLRFRRADIDRFLDRHSRTEVYS